MCFYLNLELSSVSVGIKTCPGWMCYECVQLKYETFSRCGSSSPDNAEFVQYSLLFCRVRRRNVQSFITHVYSYCFAYFLKKPFVWWGSRCRCRRALRKVPMICIARAWVITGGLWAISGEFAGGNEFHWPCSQLQALFQFAIAHVSTRVHVFSLRHSLLLLLLPNILWFLYFLSSL